MPKGGKAVTTWRLAAVMRRDGTRCWLCGERVLPRDRTIDHAIPKARGGTNHVHNLRLAHGACNHERGMIQQAAPKAGRLRLQAIFASAMSAATAATTKIGAGLQPASAVGDSRDAQPKFTSPLSGDGE